MPLAQTYNKIIYAACSEVLKHRRSIPAAQRAICDVFHDEEYRPGWSRVFGDGEEPLNLSCFEMDGTLDWLDDLTLEYHDLNGSDGDSDREDPGYYMGADYHSDPPAMIRLHSRFRSTLDELIRQSRAVNCQLPYAFIKFFRRYYYYVAHFRMLRVDYQETLQPHLHKVHPRDGVTGYVVEFIYSIFGEGVLCLYLDPGPTKSHALVWTLSCGVGCGCPEDEDEEYRTIVATKETKRKTHKGCHDIGCLNMTFLCFDFETWLAGIMCYYSCDCDSDVWERDHPAGSLRRVRFLECITANPKLKDESWSRDVEEDVRAFLSNVNTSSAA